MYNRINNFKNFYSLKILFIENIFSQNQKLYYIIYNLKKKNKKKS